MQQFKLFLFILTVIYLSKFVIEFIIKLFQENPEPMSLTKIEQIIQLVSLSYIITYILT
jgi:hypothetical protein